MELHRVDAALLVGNHREGRALGGAVDLEALRQLHHAVAMAHPHLVALARRPHALGQSGVGLQLDEGLAELLMVGALDHAAELGADGLLSRSEEHTSELQSLMRISYAVFCLKKNTT